MSNKIMDNEPEEVEALLPWYAAGTLSERDSRRVEDALRRDAVLQKQYAVIREEYAETVALNEEFGAPSSRALQTLMAAIDAEPARAQSAAAQKRPGRFAGFFASLSPRTLAWSASFGGLALMVQAGLIGTILMRSGLDAFQSADYQQHVEQTSTRSVPETTTISPSQKRSAEVSVDLASRERAPQSAPAPVRQQPASPSLQADQARPSSSVVARSQPPQAVNRSITGAPTAAMKDVIAAVTFRPDAKMSDISTLLGSYHASVVGSDGGVLRLQFEGMTTTADLNIILAALRKERIVAEAAAVP
ncbi:MAG: hypothetical protein ACTHNN_05880 [Xanthobacteraceae bacterium]